MWLHVAATAWSCSSLLNTQKPELQFQCQLWGHIGCLTVWWYKTYGRKIFRNKMCVALSSKICQRCCLPSLANASFMTTTNSNSDCFAFKNFTDMHFVTPKTETSN